MKKFTYGMAALVLFLCLAFLGCGNAVGPNGGPLGDDSGTLGIVLDSSSVKTVYDNGKPLDLSGLKVTVGSTNYDSEALIKSAESAGLLIVDPDIGTKLTTPGFQDVTVSVPGVGSTSFTIFVNSSDADLSSDFSYKISGDESTGYKLGITDTSGGPTISVDLPADCTGISVTSDADKITVTYDSESEGSETEGIVTKNIDKPVVPTPAVLTGIKVTTMPDKTVYTVGEQLDLAGLVVKAIYDGNETTAQAITGYSTDLATGDYLNTVDTITIHVKYDDATYGEKTTTFTVKVNEAEHVQVLTGIKVTTMPDKTVYTVGEQLDLAGLVVKAIYDGNETTAQAITGYSTDLATGDYLNTVDTITIHVKYDDATYGEKTTTFTVKVRELTGIKIESESTPDKKQYSYGADLDLTGLVVHPIYNDGVDESETINDNLLTTSYDPNTYGKQTVSVSYKGKTADETFEVTVMIGWTNPPSISANGKSRTVTFTFGDVVNFGDVPDPEAIKIEVAVAKPLAVVDSSVKKTLTQSTDNLKEWTLTFSLDKNDASIGTSYTIPNRDDIWETGAEPTN